MTNSVTNGVTNIMTDREADVKADDVRVDIAGNRAIASPSDAIADQAISEPVILKYFETLNAGEFQSTAALFAETGILHPPFDPELVGQAAIAHYLKREAKGMKFEPLKATYGVLEIGDTEFTVAGKVQTPLFGVNVAWSFVINSRSQILSVKIKLLAALEELLQFKRQ